MQQSLIALALAALTATGVALHPVIHAAVADPAPVPTPSTTQRAVPPVAAAAPVVDLVFVLDTTGSMEGLITAAKEKIWSIATTMARAQPTPRIRIGLVGYRDRGDEYVTRVFDLTTDLDSMYAQLMAFSAGGGGDGPESVNAALADAVNRMSWSTARGAYKVMFLVGDAPPHMDYANDVPYTTTLAAARDKGIVINAIRCGRDDAVLAPWKQIAALGQGNYLEVDANGSAVAIATPFDARLAALASAMDETRVYYGTPEVQAARQAKVEATRELDAKASLASKARRATFNATDAGALNALGEQELVEDVARGKVALDELAPSELPAALAAMPAPARAAVLEEKAAKRAQLRKEMQALASQRDDYLAREVAKSGGAASSLDAKLFGTLRDQASRVGGLELDARGPAY